MCLCVSSLLFCLFFILNPLLPPFVRRRKLEIFVRTAPTTVRAVKMDGIRNADVGASRPTGPWKGQTQLSPPGRRRTRGIPPFSNPCGPLGDEGPTDYFYRYLSPPPLPTPPSSAGCAEIPSGVSVCRNRARAPPSIIFREYFCSSQ